LALHLEEEPEEEPLGLSHFTGLSFASDAVCRIVPADFSENM